jgi:hypothetical protein
MNVLPFITARESNRDHRLQGFPYCSSWMRRLGNHVLIPKQRFSFLCVYNFQFSYPWKPYSVTSLFPGINLSVATCFPILFLETADMSQYKISENIWPQQELDPLLMQSKAVHILNSADGYTRIFITRWSILSQLDTISVNHTLWMTKQ